MTGPDKDAVAVAVILLPVTLLLLSYAVAVVLHCSCCITSCCFKHLLQLFAIADAELLLMKHDIDTVVVIVVH